MPTHTPTSLIYANPPNTPRELAIKPAEKIKVLDQLDTEAINRQINLLTDAADIGNQTEKKLKQQGQEITEIQNDLKAIDKNNKTNKKRLNKLNCLLSSCCISTESEKDKERSILKDYVEKSAPLNKSYKTSITPLYNIDNGLQKMEDLSNQLKISAHAMKDEIAKQDDQLDQVDKLQNQAIASARLR